jgi:acetyl-CoA carboxylase biotin carboxyl carrier protein
MSEKDQTQATGQARAQESPKAEVERPERGDRGGSGRGGGRRSGRRRHGGPSQQGQQPSLNMEELSELAELFTSHGLTDFEFENAEIRVRLSRSVTPSPAGSSTVTHPATGTPQPHSSGGTPPTHAAATHEPAPAEEKTEDLHIITSPIVGTFYRSPSPTADPFVRQGSRVEPDTVVCIIEAMKLMNEILAETSGTVEEVYVENGQPVEYGQSLFGIKK